MSPDNPHASCFVRMRVDQSTKSLPCEYIEIERKRVWEREKEREREIEKR